MIILDIEHMSYVWAWGHVKHLSREFIILFYEHPETDIALFGWWRLSTVVDGEIVRKFGHRTWRMPGCRDGVHLVMMKALSEYKDRLGADDGRMMLVEGGVEDAMQVLSKFATLISREAR